MPCVCLGDTYHAMGELDKAEAMYCKAVELEPEDPAAVASLARWHRIKANLKKG